MQLQKLSVQKAGFDMLTPFNACFSNQQDMGSQHFPLPKSPLRNVPSGMQELPERKKMLLP